MSSKANVDKDDRFNKIKTDPKFKQIPKKIRKVEIKDPRFSSMFTDKSFNEGLEYDEYGRKLDKSDERMKTDLEKYYTHEEQPDFIPDLLRTDHIHKEEEYESDTSEEFEQFLEERNNQQMEDPFNEIEDKNIPSGEESKRLSVMNIDWENIHAMDLYVLFSSFCQGNSKIEKVEIYPSEFGMKEMEREQKEGPSKEIFEDAIENKKKKAKKASEKIPKRKDSENSQDRNSSHSQDFQEIIHNIDDIQDYDEENLEGVNPLKLRKYELRKLKHFYAIVYCNSVETASKLYEECDGMEIEKTQSFMDLRFVPDSLTSFPYPPKEFCDHLPTTYDPKFRANSALQHSKVKLTWEANDPKRNDLLAKAFSKEQFKQEEIQQLLMSSDSESDEDAKLFAEELLGNNSEPEEDLGLLRKKKKKDLNVKEGETIEISFNKGFEGVNENISIKKTGVKDKSMWENYLEKKKNIRREKKMEERKKKEDKKNKRNGESQANKKELNLLVDDSLKNKQFKYNQNDDRFTAIRNDTRFAVDPTNKEYKKKNKQ
jgi:hypothetical protein